jgi:hypothetical protein
LQRDGPRMTAAIGVSEGDLEVVARAAIDAHKRGDMAAALALDKLARKINAALTTTEHSHMRQYTCRHVRHTWRDVPSVLVKD